MKRFFATLTALFVIILAMLSFYGCSPCQHASLKEQSNSATCTNNGVKTFICEDCGEIIEKPSIKLGHNYTITVSYTAPTCTANGEKILKCSRCDATKTETINKTSHDYVNNKCTGCGTINPEYPYIELPKTPFTISDSGYGVVYSKCIIRDIKITSSSYKTEIYFTIQKTYDIDGPSSSSSCNIAYKLYDSNNIVIDSGHIYTNRISVGETTKKTLTFYSSELSRGHQYKLVLLDIL